MITLYREKGGPLTPWEVDANFTTLRDEIRGLTGIFVEDYFLSPEGDLTFRFNDGSELGPMRLPTKALRPRGEWRQDMVYIRGDFVRHFGSSYYVHVDHQATSIDNDLEAGNLVVLASRGDDATFPEPPADGTPYARQDGEWIAIVSAEPTISEDAPADGRQFVRKDGAWSEIVFPEGGGEGGRGVADAPIDGQDYVRRDGAWSLLRHPETGSGGGIEEAPDDGGAYVRSGKAWAVLPVQTGGVGVPDAPNDNVLYGRRDGEWVAVPTATDGDFEDAPADGKPYVRQDGGWIEMPAGEGGSGNSGFMTYRGRHQGFLDYAFGDIVSLMDDSFWLCIKPVGQGGDTPSVPEPGQQSNASWRLISWPGPEAQYAQGGSIKIRTSGSTIESLLTIITDLRQRVANLENAA